MFTYTPKFHHAVISTLLLVCCLIASAKSNDRVAVAWNAGAAGFAIMTAVILWLLVLESLNHRVEVITDFARAVGELDDETRAMIAFQFPFLRYKMKRGAVRELFADTNVPVEMFRVFLQTSNEKYISPERDWFTSEKPHWAWTEIYQYLCENNYVFPNSASGNISHQWKGESYRHLCAYWRPINKIQNLAQEAV